MSTGTGSDEALAPPAAGWKRANALAAAGDWAGAADAFQRQAEAAPGDAGAWIGLARARGRNGEYRAMHAAALRACAAGPRGWPHALALARLLRGLHETRALAALADGLSAHAGRASVDDMVALADALGDEDLHEAALAWLDRAVQREPGHAPARYVRGSTRLFLGDMQGARDDLERAVAAAPHFAHAHRRLSQLRDRDPAGARARIARMRAERDRVDPGSEHDIHFSHALFDELHDLGEHAAAWPELVRGMRAKRAALRYDAGADLALVVNPSFFPGSLTAEVLAAHYVAVADASPIPILIYNVPKFTHLNIPVAAVARAATHPNIVGIKDSAGDIGQIIELLRACPSDFSVLLGNSPAFLSGLQVGATGGILALANVAPRECVAIYDLVAQGRLAEAKALQFRLMPVGRAVTAGYGVPGLKAALDLLGYTGGSPRLPLRPLEPAKVEELRAILVEAGLLG